MKPKIAIILTTNGIDTVTVLSTGSEARKAGYRLCSILEEEIYRFEIKILEKVRQFEIEEKH